RRRDFTGYTVDAARLALAKPDCMVQHPLPAHRGEEIAPDVLEQHAAEIFDEAENRLHIGKAVLAVLLAGKYTRARRGLDPAGLRYGRRVFLCWPRKAPCV